MRPITANDLMNPTVLTVRDGMTLRQLAVYLMDNEITGAPVEDGHGQLVGVVSVVDIVRSASEEDDDESGTQSEFFQCREDPGLTARDREVLRHRRAEEVLVADIMTPEVYAVTEDASVSEIASTMLDHHLHRLLVTRGGQPVGIISTSDLLGLLIDENES